MHTHGAVGGTHWAVFWTETNDTAAVRERVGAQAVSRSALALSQLQLIFWAIQCREGAARAGLSSIETTASASERHLDTGGASALVQVAPYSSRFAKPARLEARSLCAGART